MPQNDPLPSAASPSTAPPRLPPLEPPYAGDTEALLRRMTPPQAPEILALFRVLAHHPAMADRMVGFGGFLLGRGAALTPRDREIAIDRVCALSGAEYEWGVHVAAFAAQAGLTPGQVADTCRRPPDAGQWPARDHLLLQCVDALVTEADLSESLWSAAQAHWTPQQLLELAMLCGWYRGISAVCRMARVPLERWAARFPASGASAPSRPR